MLAIQGSILMMGYYMKIKLEWRKYKKKCKQKSKSVIGRLLELVASSGEMVADHSMDDYIELLTNTKLRK